MLSPLTIVLAIRYRIFRPFVWRRITLPRLLRLSDEAFFRAQGWKQTAQDLLAQLREQGRLRFFFHPRNRKDFFLNTLTRTQPLDSILAEADDVLNDRFQALGSQTVFLGSPIPWQRDFKSGKEWPLRKLSVEEILDLENPSDVKVPWELSRFHQVWWLGKAYWLTGNQAYAEKFGGLVSNWIEMNPVGKGVNWPIAMEVSIRACNWIAGYHLFCESQTLKPEFWVQFMRSLLVHGAFIESHLEYARVNHNHFLSNVVGLIYIGMFFRDLPIGKRWLHWGVRELEKQMQEQVYDDGVDHEKATAYHRLVLEFFYSSALLCKINNVTLSPPFWEKLGRMFDFLQAYSRTDGTTPLVGDADDGRLFRFSMHQPINDHRHALSVGAILFKRPDLNAAAGRFDQEALWYFGGEGFEIHRTLGMGNKQQESRAFPAGGFYVMRTEHTHVFVDAGEIGLRGRGDHGHNDILSFELWHHAPFIVDSGTYTYSADAKTRKLLQGTASHNTVMVDDIETADWTELWSIRNDSTNPSVLKWSTDSATDVLETEHFGYHRLPDPVVHRRKIVFDKTNNELQVTDTLTGQQAHTLQLRLHVHPAVSIEREEKNRYLATNGDHRIRIAISEEADMIKTLYSPSYGILQQSTGLQIRLRKAFPHTVTTRITLL
ncbi:MAG: alginate lyase family protein [Bacteroidota bacterium]